MTFKELLTEKFGDVELKYTGTILGTTDEPWTGTGKKIYADCLKMFDEEDLEIEPVLDEHPAYTGKHGWYIQSGDIWNNGYSEERVFEIIQ